ncbi:hypothetical protein VSS92_28045, partial [Pseudomonas syringae pv. tagetis]
LGGGCGFGVGVCGGCGCGGGGGCFLGGGGGVVVCCGGVGGCLWGWGWWLLSEFLWCLWFCVGGGGWCCWGWLWAGCFFCFLFYGFIIFFIFPRPRL